MKKNNSNSYGFKTLENKISQILKPILTKKKDNFLVINNLYKNWQKIVGEQCFKHCFPKKITFEKGKKINGVLTIGAGNSAVSFYLEANSNQIIQSIASYYGYKIVGKIRIIQEPTISDQLDDKIIKAVSKESQDLINESTKIIKDEELKSVLQRLGKSILK
ncbi:MAG: hypothetical protein ACJA0S_000438 [Rickettsiales bacterium]|jgi:hypothetical protein